jgi:hypothetical protein
VVKLLERCHVIWDVKLPDATAIDRRRSPAV